MFDWLKQSTLSEENSLDLAVLVGRLAAAFMMGLLVAAVYYFAIRRPGQKANLSFLATLVLLAGLIGLVTLVIGNSVARAFSLVGALAIVRFRTVVEDTRDTAFVIFSVAAGMAAGTGYIIAPLVCMPPAFLASWLFRSRESAAQVKGTLILRFNAGRPPGDDLQNVLRQHLHTCNLIGLSTARGGSALDFTYAVTVSGPEQIVAVVQALNRIEGIQSVEVRTQD